MGLRESGCLRSTLEYSGISIGSRTSFSVEVPAISGYDPEIYTNTEPQWYWKSKYYNKPGEDKRQQPNGLSIYKVAGRV